MSDYVWLELKRNRGWPWPEGSFGNTPMYGEDGWCHTCGTPVAQQSGSLVLQARGMASLSGSWTPNWQHDLLCVDESLADTLQEEFAVAFVPVLSPKGKEIAARQLVIPVTNEDWYRPHQLTSTLREAHGTDGAQCTACSVWRWMPLAEERLPRPHPDTAAATNPAIASPEWFGDGLNSFRHTLFRRELALALTEWGNCDFRMQELDSRG